MTVDKLTDSDLNNFGPQIGFAWSPYRFDDKLVIRGGFGIGYDRLPNALLANTRANPPNGARYGLCCASETNPFVGGQIVYALGSSNEPTSYPRHPGIGGGFNPVTGGPNIGRIEIWGVDPNLKTSQIYRYSLEAQYEMPWAFVGTLGYQASFSFNFPLTN